MLFIERLTRSQQDTHKKPIQITLILHSRHLAMSTRTVYHYVIVSTIFGVLQWQCWFGIVYCTNTGSTLQRSHNDQTNFMPDTTFATYTTVARQWLSSIRSRQHTKFDKRNGRPDLLATSTRPFGTAVNSPATSESILHYFGRSAPIGTAPTSATIIPSTLSSHLKMVNGMNILVLVQKSNIQINVVREQFHRVIEAFGITLPNVTIDFNTIGGKYSTCG